jgi:hypothetical protein
MMSRLLYVGFWLLAGYGAILTAVDEPPLQCSEAHVVHVVMRFNEAAELEAVERRCAQPTRDAIRMGRDADGNIVRERF